MGATEKNGQEQAQLSKGTIGITFVIKTVIVPVVVPHAIPWGLGWVNFRNGGIGEFHRECTPPTWLPEPPHVCHPSKGIYRGRIGVGYTKNKRKSTK